MDGACGPYALMMSLIINGLSLVMKLFISLMNKIGNYTQYDHPTNH
jgi:hypothetical protein